MRDIVAVVQGEIKVILCRRASGCRPKGKLWDSKSCGQVERSVRTREQTLPRLPTSIHWLSIRFSKNRVKSIQRPSKYSVRVLSRTGCSKLFKPLLGSNFHHRYQRQIRGIRETILTKEVGRNGFTGSRDWHAFYKSTWSSQACCLRSAAENHILVQKPKCR